MSQHPFVPYGRYARRLAGLLGLLLLPPSVALGQQDRLARRRTPVVEAVALTEQTVANISTERIRIVRYYDSPFSFRDRFLDRFHDDFFGRYRDKRFKVESPIGSGVIIDDSGYILTNDHVVSKASNLKITLSDKSEFDGVLVSTNPDNDLAVIKIESRKPLKAISLGRGDDLMLGETVIALGNPLGLENTVTTGVISALDREITLRGDRAQITYRGLIQTDAAINPGNSGGPLININGELIGINTAIVDAAEGIGFAISVSHVRNILTDLLNFRKLRKVWIGIAVSPTDKGIEIEKVSPNSPAEKAGIKKGDFLTGVDAVAVDSPLTFTQYMVKKKAGDTVQLKIRRGDQELTKPITIEEAPRPPAQELALKLFGLKVQDLTPELAQELALRVREGVLIYGVQKGTPAERFLRSGDVIAQLGRQRVRNLEDLGAVLETISPGEAADLWIVRGQYLLNTTMRAR